MLTEGARFLASQDVKMKFRECHTRYQRRVFKEKLQNITSVQPAVVDLIYKELALDASAAQHPQTMERLQLIFLGNEDLVADLRSLNPGRPGNTFDIFFEEMAKIVEEVTIADDRRHNEVHLASWISMRDLIEQTRSRCPEGTAVPSTTLVRLQFSPRNHYTKRALNFTSKLEVQYTVQSLQLRAQHPDQHYAAAQLKYLREFAVDLTNERAILLFSDDNAKIPVGEPGQLVSTGVRGKKTITPSSIELMALHHDMTKCSLTPSVYMLRDIPSELDQSFYGGRVVTTVNDSVFDSSSPWRHAATMVKLFDASAPQKIFMLFTDGGMNE